MAEWCVRLFLLIVPVAVSLSPSDYGTWIPDTERSRDDWLRCHGFPCDRWAVTKVKLQELKMMMARPGMALQLLVNDTDDSLDSCIWLTEEQLDNIFIEMEDVVREEMRAEEPDEYYPKTRRTKRKVTNFRRFPFSKWPTKLVHWKFDGEHNEEEKKIIRGAFSHWQEQTCMRFRELGVHESYSDHHILITRQRTGCHSFIGRITAIPQQLNLQRECLYSLGTPVHEIGHALGLWHEQQRSDRDSAIRVLWQNLGFYVGQFHKESTDNLTPYDYGSVMHYGPRDGSNNSKNTMETLNPLYQHNIGQRTGLSFLDAKAINLAYCQDACDGPTPKCQHSGYQDPNDCFRCKCPDGLAGRLCEELAPPENADCGGELSLSSTPLYIESPGYKRRPYDNHITCSWRVKVPPGDHISLKFEENFAIYAYYQGQCHHWVEVRYKQDIGAQGPRFCGYKLPDDTVISEDNEMLIVFKSNWTASGAYSRLGFRAKLERVGLGAPTTNVKSTTTTTSTTTKTTTTTTTTTPSIHYSTTSPVKSNDCDVVDVMLVMDSSGGVMKDNWVKVLQFAERIVRQFAVGADGVHVGVVTYASHAEVSVGLGALRSAGAVRRAIDAIPFLAGATNTHVGFLAMRSQFGARARPGVRKVGVLITDGQTALPYLAIRQAASARAEGVELYVVGIDRHFDYGEAASMVDDKKHIVRVESFDDLVSSAFDYGAAVREKLCDEGVVQASSDLSWSCDFEDSAAPFCDMTQDTATDQFDWTRQSGPTPSKATGPQRAYSGSYYAYIEASDPRRPEDSAILYLPDFNVQGTHCLSFAYSMYGFHVRTLQVMKKTSAGSLVPVWLMTGDQGRKWYTARITVNLHRGDRIMFRAKRGGAYSGDIGIDELRIGGGDCGSQGSDQPGDSDTGRASSVYGDRTAAALCLALALVLSSLSSSCGR